MEWFILAIIAPALWGIGNLLDKYLFDRFVKNPFSYQILTAFTDLPILITLIILFGLKLIPALALVGIIVGFIGFFSFVLYNKALMIEETSRVASLIYLNPLFIIPLAIIFLGEVLSLTKYIGIFLLIASAFLITYKKVNGKNKFWSFALSLMILFSVLWAGYQVISKYMLVTYSYWDWVIWITIGSIGGSMFLFLFKKIRTDFVKQVKIPKVILFRLGGTITYYIALISFLAAMSVKDVTLVGAIPATQPLFVLIYVILLSKFIPKIYKEPLEKKTIALKFSAVIAVIIGTYLILI